jgi:hypothetical protein
LNSKGEKQTEQDDVQNNLPSPTGAQMVAMKVKVRKGELKLSQIKEKFNLTKEEVAILNAEVPAGEDDGELPF